MPKINLKKLGASALKIAVPIAAAVIAQKMTTGKIDVKTALVDAVRKAFAERMGV